MLKFIVGLSSYFDSLESSHGNQLLTPEHLTVQSRSTILRTAWWLFLASAAFAALGLVHEVWQSTQSMPDRGWNFQIARIVGLVFLNLLFTA
ncbi:hypothetical protein SH139x_005289 [Planctomycetaceae bacterium SH139]